MSTVIIDRRLNSKGKCIVNRERFLRRYCDQIKKAVGEAVSRRSITDNKRGEDIAIVEKSLAEPRFHHGRGGRQQCTHPGNKEFISGDLLPKNIDGSGQESGEGKVSNRGSGVDEFVFQINRDEFLEYLFDDLALPNMARKELKEDTEFLFRRGGFTSLGSPDRLNITRTLRSAHARRIALSGKERKNIRRLKRELREMEVSPEEIDQQGSDRLRARIRELNNKIKRLPFVDAFDLKYNNMIKVPIPSNRAVMFCVMDVSGSMNSDIKDLAKRFFFLLYMFLQCNYEQVELVFIRHHTEARECDEYDFFCARETGGTVVSSALILAADIIAERYNPNAYNIYLAQVSDGDNWDTDTPICARIITERLMPVLSYFAYVEIDGHQHQSMWYEYKNLEQQFKDYFAMAHIASPAEIYPVFRALFEKRELAA